MLEVHLIMNTDREKYGTLIKDYDRKYLGGINKYPKTLQDVYNLMKGWNKHKKTGQRYLKVGVSFNTVREEVVGSSCKRLSKASKIQQMWSQQPHSG